MQRLLSFHLLGFLLLLSQLPRESQGEDLDTVIKACGRELVRKRIDACGRSLSSWRDGRERREAGPPRETKPTSKKMDENTSKMLGEYIAKFLRRTFSPNHPTIIKLQQLALENKDISFKEFQEIISNTVTEGNNIPSKLISKGANKKPRKKREETDSLSSKCCNSGCTFREIVRYC